MAIETDPIQAPPAINTDLIVYQLGEVKGLVSTMSVKLDQYKSDSDKRFIELEKFQAAQMQQDATAPRLDIQKIILAAFSLVSTIAAIAFGFYDFHR